MVIPPPVDETIIEEEDGGDSVTPTGQTAAAVVNTISVSLGDSFDWLGFANGLDYESGYSACDATLEPSAPVNRNAFVSSFASPPPPIDYSPLHIASSNSPKLGASSPPKVLSPVSLLQHYVMWFWWLRTLVP